MNASALLPVFEVKVTPESVARWQFGRDGTLSPPPAEGSPVPLAYFVFLRVQPLRGVSVHALLARDPDRGLYGGVTYRAERSPAVGATLRAASAITGRREVVTERGTLVLRTIETRYQDGADTVLAESVRTVDLPPGPPTAPASGPRRTPALPRIAEIAPITPTQIAWITVETGDMNPLHLDLRYAKGRLYPNIVVPGTLTAAILERELARASGRALRELDVRLLAASFPDEPLQLHAGPKGDGMAYELFAGAELRAEGSAR